MTAATPAKLKDGSWGARVPGKPIPGTIVEIQARNGKAWSAAVSRVLWTGPDKYTGETVSLCSTESLDRAPARRTYRGSDNGCPQCCWTPTRTAQIWEDCESCGAEPVYR